jgi:hypothetical protein
MRFVFTENLFRAISHGRIVALPATFNINITRSGIRLQKLGKMNAFVIGSSLVTLLLLAMPASSQDDVTIMDVGALTEDENLVTKFINCCLYESDCGEEVLSARG